MVTNFMNNIACWSRSGELQHQAFEVESRYTAEAEISHDKLHFVHTVRYQRTNLFIYY